MHNCKNHSRPTFGRARLTVQILASLFAGLLVAMVMATALAVIIVSFNGCLARPNVTVARCATAVLNDFQSLIAGGLGAALAAFAAYFVWKQVILLGSQAGVMREHAVIAQRQMQIVERQDTDKRLDQVQEFQRRHQLMWNELARCLNAHSDEEISIRFRSGIRRIDRTANSTVASDTLNLDGVIGNFRRSLELITELRREGWAGSDVGLWKPILSSVKRASDFFERYNSVKARLDDRPPERAREQVDPGIHPRDHQERLQAANLAAERTFQDHEAAIVAELSALMDEFDRSGFLSAIEQSYRPLATIRDEVASSHVSAIARLRARQLELV